MSACPLRKRLGPGDPELRILPRPQPSGGCFPHSSPSSPWGLAALVRAGLSGFFRGHRPGETLRFREKACGVGESKGLTLTLLLHDSWPWASSLPLRACLNHTVRIRLPQSVYESQVRGPGRGCYKPKGRGEGLGFSRRGTDNKCGTGHGWSGEAGADVGFEGEGE